MTTQSVLNSTSALMNHSYHSLVVLANRWQQPEDLRQKKFTRSLSQEIQ